MKILICGVGAIGSNLAANLASDLKGEHEITILDMDKIEERNVQAGTQFYQKDQVGVNKVEALQYNIYKWFERDIIIDYHEIVEGDEFKADLIIDCLDNQKARNILKQQTTPVLHIGFSDQFTFAIEWNDNYKVPTDITSGFDICEMQGAASFVKMVAALGALTAQEFVKDESKIEFIGNRFNIRKLR